MGEHSITHAKASVMLYDNERKQWQHSGGTPGLSRVNIYHHPVNNTFRIVGRKLDDHAVVINCALARGLKYNEATPTFHQWRDQRQVYGLNFQSSDDANRFGQEVRKALEVLKEAASMASAPPPPAQSYQQREQFYQETNGPSHEDIQRQQHSRQNSDYDAHDNYSSRNRVPSAGGQYRQYDSQLSGGGSESESPNSSQLSVASSVIQSSPVQTSAPPAPTPPPAPPVPTAPAAPPAPAPPQPPPVPAAGGPPAPPPPPPAPSGGGGGGSLADQIAAAKLRKSSASREPAPSDGGGMRTERAASRSNNAGGVGGMDMMAEMQRKLAARRAKTEDKPVSNGPVKQQEEERSFPAVRSISTSNSPTPPPFSNNKSNFGNAQPKTTSVTSTSRFNNSTAPKGDVTLSSDQLEEFKTELLSAFRQELENYKEEIIQAVRQEITKNM